MPYIGDGNCRPTPALGEDSLLAAPSRLLRPGHPRGEDGAGAANTAAGRGAPRVGMVTRSVCWRCRPERSVPARGSGYRLYADDDQARFTPARGDDRIRKALTRSGPAVHPRAGRKGDGARGTEPAARFTPARGGGRRYPPIQIAGLPGSPPARGECIRPLH